MVLLPACEQLGLPMAAGPVRQRHAHVQIAHSDIEPAPEQIQELHLIIITAYALASSLWFIQQSLQCVCALHGKRM